jgi:rRNA maturation endonuclease Nob1
MTRIQRLALLLLPKRLAGEIETESRAWHLRCTGCGEEVSVWDVGGVRFKAKGNPRYRRACVHCGTTTRHDMVKHPPTAG